MINNFKRMINGSKYLFKLRKYNMIEDAGITMFFTEKSFQPFQDNIIYWIESNTIEISCISNCSSKTMSKMLNDIFDTFFRFFGQ